MTYCGSNESMTFKLNPSALLVLTIAIANFTRSPASMFEMFALIGVVARSAAAIAAENGTPPIPGAAKDVDAGVEEKLGVIPSVDTKPFVICSSGAATRFWAIELDDRFSVVVNPYVAFAWFVSSSPSSKRMS